MTMNVSAERAVLGACLLSEKAARQAVEEIEVNEFSPKNAVIFEKIAELLADGKIPDSLLLSRACPSIEPVYIFTLTDDCPTELNLRHYIELVKDANKKSQIDGLAKEISNISQRVSSEEVLENVQEKINGMDLGERSLMTPAEAAPALMNLYRNGWPEPLSTGWKAFDELNSEHGAFKIAPGELTLITGIPGHGKSTFVDALMVNMIQRYNWKVLFLSPENWPYEVHLRLLLEKMINKPFDRGPTERMSESEIGDALKLLNRQIRYIRPEQKKLVSHILRSRGFDAIVIDPWNHVEERRDTDRSETDYVLRVLMKLRLMARKTKTHIFLVVHPAKLQRNKDGIYPKPSPYDLHGSAHFRNVADNILRVWRDFDSGTTLTEIMIQKVRHRWNGKAGDLRLGYNKITGNYNNCEAL